MYSSKTKCLKILHVEDSPDHQELMREVLTHLSWTFNLRQCSSKVEAQQLFSAEADFDLVLLDYYVNGESTEDLIDCFTGVPVVVVTVLEDEDIDSSLIQRGAADFLAKRELSPTVLKRVIRHALDRQKIINQLSHDSTHDVLTGLHNRRFVESELAKMIDESQRYDSKFSACMIDLDGLKLINDNHGHVVGDIAIRVVADAIEDAHRGSDVVARLSGDEFMVLFPHTSASEAAAFITRASQTVKASPLKLRDGSLPISISCGLLDYSGQSLELFVCDMDKVLYQAKEAGKGCVWINGERLD